MDSVTIILLLASSVPMCLTNRLTYRSHSTASDPEVCFKNAVCQQIQNATCFGTSLPYSFTSFSLAEDSMSFFEVQDNLAMWKGLRSVPRCWAVVQPLLCAVYMPKCENGSIFLPSQEMCRITRGPCRVIDVKHSWPPFLQCENKKLFPSGCRNPLQEIKFNVTSKCMKPLVETDIVENWYDDVDGCGIQCQDPFFTDQEHDYTHQIILLLTVPSFLMTLFAVLTLGISFKSSDYYPNRIIFFLNLCLCLASIGWFIQFLGVREEIVCLPDGTIRRGQLRSSYNVCVITFVLVYSFLMAAVIWFMILTYALKIAYSGTRVSKDAVGKKASYFHIFAWCITVVLSVVIMATNEIDGDSMSGICFVGYANLNVRAGFLLLPICVAVIISAVFLCLVLYKLVKIKLHNKENNPLVKRKIHRNIINISINLIGTVLIFICSFSCHLHEYLNRGKWTESLRDYIVCLAMNSEIHMTKCVLSSKPSSTTLLLNVACFLGFAFMSSFWVMTEASIEHWKLFFFKLCAPRTAKRIKKHQLISKAFERRPQINQGQLSLSLDSNYEDPIGLNLEVDSVASRDISSSWTMALPQFIMRRNAFPSINPPFYPRQYSSASDISHHMSMDSFNQSNLDSLSLQISEMEYASKHQRRKTKKEREKERKLLKAMKKEKKRVLQAQKQALSNRRHSDTSLQSSMMTDSIFTFGKDTKSTSTGDLYAQAGSLLASASGGAVMHPAMFQPPVNRPNIVREVVNPPFTHGMDDNSHRLVCQNVAPSVAASSASQRFTPNPTQPNFPNPLGGSVPPPMYGQGFDIMNAMQYGYMGGMYPSMNGVHPGFPQSYDFTYSSFSMPFGAYGSYPNAEPLISQYANLIPMHPRVESDSEHEYFPISPYDSEYTDTGLRSCDEAKFIAAQRLMKESTMNTQVLSKDHKPKPGLEPQECAKTQFLKRTSSFIANPVTDSTQPTSGVKSSHSEVPPPSLAGSSESLDMGDDEVFENEAEPPQNSSMLSLSPESKGVFQKLKAKFKRSVSVIKKSPEDDLAAAKPLSLSLKNLTEMRLSPVPKSKTKETCLHASEKFSLMPAKEGNENVSR